LSAAQAALEQERQTAAQAQKALAETRKHLDELTAANGKLEGALASSAKSVDELAATRRELATAKEKLAALDADNATQAVGLEAAARELTNLRAQVADAGKKSQTDAEAKLAVALRSYTVVQDENNALRTRSEKLVAENGTLQTELATAKQAVEAFRSSGESTKPAGVADAAASQEQLRQIQEQVARLADENTQLKQQLAQSARTDVESVRAQANAAERTLAELQNANRQLSEENARLKATVAGGPSATGRSAPSGAGIAATNAPVRPTSSVPGLLNSPLRPGTPQAAAATASPAVPAPAVRTHVIVAGDTLGRISRQYYGTSTRWAEIFAANRDVLSDERSLTVGRTLRIP
jgi:nucleoid-associated protein YgaU